MSQAKKLKEKIEDIINNIEHMETVQVQNLKVMLGKFM